MYAHIKMICRVCDHIVQHPNIPLPRYIVIENQASQDLTIVDKQERTLTIPQNDKIVGPFNIDQEITFPPNTTLYCRHICNLIYITNNLSPYWQHNFFLGCGGITTKLETKNHAPVMINPTEQPIAFNNMFLISSIELHFRFFNPACQPSLPEPLIPHIIHFIWLKGKEFNKGYIESWVEHHPDYLIYLWTDFEPQDLSLPPNITIKNSQEISNEVNSQPSHVSQLYHESDIPGIKSDILRYIVLYKYGGIYADINDFECFRPINPLTYQYKFIAGVETCHADKDDGLLINNAFIAGQPQHPILHRVLQALNTPRNISQHPERIDDYVCELSGPILFRMVTLGYFIDPTIIDKTKDILLPAVYLYPACFYDTQTDRHVNSFTEQNEKWMHNVTLAAHYSDHSYLLHA